MNILNLSLRYYPASGGAEDLNKSVTEKLSKRGYNFSVFSTRLKDHIANLNFIPSAADHEYDDKNNIRRFKTIKIPKTVYHIIPGFLTAGMSLKNIDLIHSWTMMYFPAISGLLLKLLKNKPLILNPIVDENNLIHRKLYSDTFGKLTVSRADCISVLTRYSIEVLNKYGFKFKNYEIIPAGVDISEFNESLEKSGFINNNKFNLLFAGRLARGKGIDVLLKSMKILDSEKIQIHLNIAGPDFGDFQRLKKMSEELGLIDNITFCGKLDRIELVKLFKSSNAFILPSRYEAFGIVLIEAMAAGIPVIGSNISAIPFVIDNEKTGLLFEPDNSQELADKIKLLINRPDIVSTLVDNAAAKVEREYNWEKVISKYSMLYEKFR
ncbi:MAG TPA: glycosyltransferase family 4 protein [bacterium]|nr:glycosyltransferase family 4 protein [bacterium]HPN31034.1 glycosyltransferase family 4 protein [bacterium]